MLPVVEPGRIAMHFHDTYGRATANATLEDAAAALDIVHAAYGRRTP